MLILQRCNAYCLHQLGNYCFLFDVYNCTILKEEETIFPVMYSIISGPIYRLKITEIKNTEVHNHINQVSCDLQ